jgi:predicted AlkP superfamily phosphohydrolase/phosphomutase
MEKEMIGNSGKKVLAIGLDSASPSLIEQWVGEGKLPVFQRLINSGCYGRLESTVPALTPPAWTSSLTGTNPGKHNIYDFFRVTPKHGKEIISSKDRKSKAIWNLLHEFGRQSIILNVPLTYPAEQFNGIMVTGLPTPNLHKGFVSPEILRDKVLNLIGGRKLGIDIIKLLRGDENEFLKDIEEVTDRISRLALHLINNTFDWDFFMVVFDDLDRLQHVFWHYMDPRHPFYDERKANTYRDAILHFYQYLEKQIEGFLQILGDETILMVFSDHGMKPLYRNFYINNFFMDCGWLKTKKQMLDLKIILRCIGLSYENINLFLNKTRLQSLVKRILPPDLWAFFRKNLPAETVELELIDWSKILDWDHTLAYFCSKTGLGILINREKVKNYEKFREEIAMKLENLKDPYTDKYVVKKVHKREEVFNGPYLFNAPDMLVEPAETYEPQEVLGKEIFETVNKNRVPISAIHHKEGILIIYGKSDLKQNLRISNVNIVDIAPTILYSLGLSIPQEMDGRVISEVFTEEFLRNRPVQYSNFPLQMENTPGSITPADKATIAEQLRSMGYMD